MAKQKSIKINFIMNIILTMSSFLFPLITFPYISRILLANGTGKVDFATSVINYFNMIAQLGIPTYGIRVCAQVRDDRQKLTRVAHELLIINLIMSIISYIILFNAIQFIPRFHSDKELLMIISFTIILTSIGMEWLYKALEQYTYITIRSIIFKFIALVAMFMLIHSQSDYVIYGAISIFASSASNIFNFINAHKYIGFKPVGNYHFLKHLKPIFVFFGMACATTVYTNLDTVMLGFMKSDVDVGYYNAAVKMKNIFVSVVTSLGTVLLPRASYYIKSGDRSSFNKVSKQAMNVVVLISLPLVVYFFIYAKYGILLLSGKAFLNSVVPMRVIMPTIVLIGLSNITGIQILVPLGYERIVLFSEVIGVLVDLVVNWLLIPYFGATGAAVGTLIAEFVVLLVQFPYARREVKNMFSNIKFYKFAIALSLATVSSIIVLYFALPTFIILAISAILFFGVYLVILLLLKESMIIKLYYDITSKFIKNRGEE